MNQEKIFSTSDYRRSRAAYVAECMFEYFVLLLMTDAFLAKLLSSVGFSDGEIGVLTSFLSIAFVFQLFAMLWAGRRGSKKVLVLVLDTIGQMLFFVLFVLPFVGLDPAIRRALVYVCIVSAYACKQMVATLLFQWANGYVDPHKRASYSATKEMVSLVGGTIFSLLMGYIFDRYEAAGNLTGGFVFLAIVILVCNVGTFWMVFSVPSARTVRMRVIDGLDRPLPGS